MSGAHKCHEAQLRIEVLGPLRLTYEGREIEIQGRKARALIGALVLGEDWRQPRERFVGLLWSGAENDERARASLRTAIYDVQKAIHAAGSTLFGSDKQHLWFDKSKVVVDLWEALASARAGRPVAALVERDRIAENILADCDGVDPSFRDWLLAKRQSAQTRLVAALEDSLRALPQGTGDPNVEPIARALMRLDPTHEEAARALIRSRAAAGDLGAAFGIYKALWDLLERDFDVQPSMETQDLVAQIRLAQPEVGLAPSSVPALAASVQSQSFVLPERLQAPPAKPRKLVLAIGTFDASGVKPEARYLISGFRQELSACLVRFREWSVRDQIQAVNGARSAQPESQYAIEASAFEAGDGVRLVLMLRDAATGEYVWSERLSLKLENWFDAQEVVVRRLAMALNVHLSAERIVLLASKPKEQIYAHDKWLRAQSLLMHFSVTDWHEAIRVLESVVSENPSFAPALVGLANAHNIIHIVHPGIARTDERTRHALELARSAVQLDPVDPRAQLCLGWSCAMSGQYDEAEARVLLALELNENDPWLLISAATCLAFCGQDRRASELAGIALSLPVQPSPAGWSYIATIRFILKDYTGCVDAAIQAGSTNPNVPGFKAAALFLIGDFATARSAYIMFMERMRTAWFPTDYIPSDKEILTWFLHLFPFRSQETFGGLRRGIIGAGAVEADL